LLQKEQLAGESVCVRIVPSANQLVIGKDKSFTFDHVLPSKVVQVKSSTVSNACKLLLLSIVLQAVVLCRVSVQ